MLSHIDSFLQGKAQKFCDKLQRITGLTKFWPQKWAAIFSAVCLSVQAFADSDVILILLALLDSLSIVALVFIYESEEAQFLKNGEISYSQWQESSRRRIAVFFQGGFAIMFSLESLWPLVFSVACVIAWIYFCACIPRPPSKSKMREWVEKALAKLNGILPDPAPEPVPN
jgi:hypothetical protein